MLRSELLRLIDLHCFRSDGQINSAMIKRDNWVKIGQESVYDTLVSCCEHPNPGLAQIIYHVRNDLPTKKLCDNPNCNNLAVWNRQSSSYKLTCSRECASKSANRLNRWKETNFRRYGQGQYGQAQTAALDKRKQTSTEKYGVDSWSKTQENRNNLSLNNPMKNAQTVDKWRDSILDKYGAYPLSLTKFIEKRNQTCLDKYGVTHAMKTTTVQQRHGNSMKQKYGVSNSKHIDFPQDALVILKDREKLRSALKEMSVTDFANAYGVDVTTVYQNIHKLDLSDLVKDSTSQLEEVFYSLLQTLIPVSEIVRQDRKVLQGKELDFYIPKHNLAIEVNGIYWHSTAANAGRSNTFHYDKWLACRNQGITLLQYTNYDLSHRKSIITNKLTYMINGCTNRIGARLCQIGTVTTADERMLMEGNHIQGFLSSRSDSLGAYHNDQLVAVINWVMRPKYLEITRYCSDVTNGTSYPGLFSRMIKAMCDKLSYQGDIVSFSNNDHSNGRVYAAAGFEQDQILGPAYWYTADFVHLENRQKYMKDKIAKTFGVDVANKTEKQLMEQLGYHRYYDSGKIKWILRNRKNDKSI